VEVAKRNWICQEIGLQLRTARMSDHVSNLLVLRHMYDYECVVVQWSNSFAPSCRYWSQSKTMSTREAKALAELLNKHAKAANATDAFFVTYPYALRRKCNAYECRCHTPSCHSYMTNSADEIPQVDFNAGQMLATYMNAAGPEVVSRS